MSAASELKSQNEPAGLPQEKIGILRTLWGLFGAPAAWVAQLLLSEPIAAHACYPYRAPLAEPIWGGLVAILALITAACLIIALASGFVAWTSWRKIAHKPAGTEPDAVKRYYARVRFIVKLSLMSSFIFIVGVIFNTCAVILVSPCSPWF